MTLKLTGTDRQAGRRTDRTTYWVRLTLWIKRIFEDIITICSRYVSSKVIMEYLLYSSPVPGRLYITDWLKWHIYRFLCFFTWYLPLCCCESHGGVNHKWQLFICSALGMLAGVPDTYILHITNIWHCISIILIPAFPFSLLMFKKCRKANEAACIHAYAYLHESRLPPKGRLPLKVIFHKP